MSARRYFTDDDARCLPGGHLPGDVHVDHGGGHDLIFTADRVWAPLCPDCDVAMVDRDAHGWLRCGSCLILAVNR